jgi:hypothetical protein
MLTSGARAETYAFDVSTANFVITGDLATSNSLDAVGGYDVTSISGTVVGSGGAAISGLITNPNQPNPYTGGAGPWIYDNVLFPTLNPVVDNPGILFSAGAYEYNAYSVGTTYYLSTNNPAGNYNPGETFVSGSISAVPEPATWAMMLLGFAGLGFAGYRRTLKGTATVAAA